MGLVRISQKTLKGTQLPLGSVSVSLWPSVFTSVSHCISFYYSLNIFFQTLCI